jgi:hypothetical protein
MCQRETFTRPQEWISGEVQMVMCMAMAQRKPASVRVPQPLARALGLWLLLLPFSSVSSTPLDDYVHKPDANYRPDTHCLPLSLSLCLFLSCECCVKILPTESSNAEPHTCLLADGTTPGGDCAAGLSRARGRAWCST